MMRLISAAGLAFVLAACSQPAPAPAPEPEAPAAPAKQAPPVTDSWIGEWTGINGAMLTIEAGDTPGVYKITEGTVDGPMEYTGAATGEAITMIRAGQPETIRPGTGADTGLKQLAEKQNCLVIEEGRGFCRD